MAYRSDRDLPAHVTIPNWNAYQVRIVRNEVEYSKSFPWSRAGQAAALEAAVMWREAQLAALGPAWNDKGGLRRKPLRHKKSGYPVGITCYLRSDRRKSGDPLYLTFGVNYINRKGKKTTRSFQVGNIEIIGQRDKEHAEQTAKAFRAEYEWCRCHGKIFKPERYVRWREVKMYPFKEP